MNVLRSAQVELRSHVVAQPAEGSDLTIDYINSWSSKFQFFVSISLVDENHKRFYFIEHIHQKNRLEQKLFSIIHQCLVSQVILVIFVYLSFGLLYLLITVSNARRRRCFQVVNCIYLFY